MRGNEETLAYIRRLEQANDDLRRRNGEMFVALQEADEDAAANLTPTGLGPTRYKLIDSAMTNLAIYALRDDSEALEQACDDIRRVENYWDQIAEQAAINSDRAKKRMETRRRNEVSI